MFLTFPKTKFNLSVTFILLSGTALNLVNGSVEIGNRHLRPFSALFQLYHATSEPAHAFLEFFLQYSAQHSFQDHAASQREKNESCLNPFPCGKF